MEPVRTNSSKLPIAVGKPETIPPKIMMEMPLPSPRSVICSPSHIRNIVPVTKVTTVLSSNIKPGLITKPGCACNATEIPNAWNVAKNTVP